MDRLLPGKSSAASRALLGELENTLKRKQTRDNILTNALKNKSVNLECVCRGLWGSKSHRYRIKYEFGSRYQIPAFTL